MQRSRAVCRHTPQPRLNPLDMPYACMSKPGQVDRVVDRDGRTLPASWTGLCVTAASTQEYWLIAVRDGIRHTTRVGRFRTVSDAMASISA